MNFMDKHSSITAYAAGTWSVVFGGVTLNEFAVITGIVCTLGTFLVNWYYKARDDTRRDRRETDVCRTDSE